MTESIDWLKVGKIVGAQGLGGQLRVKPATDFPERFTKPGSRWLRDLKGGKPRKVELEKGRKMPGKSLFVVKLEGIENRNAAEELIGQEVLVSAENRPELAEGEFHFLDLVGLEARLTNNDISIGNVSDLINAGNDLLEVTTNNGRKLLIPFVEEIVPEVNVKEGWLKISPPPGLLDL